MGSIRGGPAPHSPAAANAPPAATFCSARFGHMNRFVAPAAASVVVGLLLGAAAIFGITLMVQQDTKPPLPGGDPQSSVLNRVEYGNRS
jgi:Protein of unknown function (DUF2613)